MEKIGNDEVRVRVLHYGVERLPNRTSAWPKPRARRSSASTSAPMRPRATRPTRRASNPLLLGDLRPCGRREGGGLWPAGCPRSARTSSAMPRSRRSSRSRASQCRRLSGDRRGRPSFRRRAPAARRRGDPRKARSRRSSASRTRSRKVQSGQECGMAFENYEDIRKGDVIENLRTRRGRALAGVIAFTGSAKGALRAPFFFARMSLYYQVAPRGLTHDREDIRFPQRPAGRLCPQAGGRKAAMPASAP